MEPYRTVWQMTSTVQGLLQPGTSLTQIMRAVYPGASITGAPKHHTMEIIAQVETEPRGVYTGTVALFSPGGDFTGNIGIRTITRRGGRCTFGVGSGVVWDATAPAEYEETLAKGAFAVAPPSGDWRPARAGAAPVPGLRLFETILLEPDGRYRHMEEHLARMASSAQAPAAATAPASLMVSPFRVDQDDPLLAHKTTQRGFYDREHRRAVAEGCFDALFINRLDRVTEGSITNIFARFGDAWVTPPLADGLLPGIWRTVFLAEKAAVERSLTLDELLEADEIVAGNSVRGAVRVAALLADPLAY